jgi:hypothetical protein
VDKCDGANQYVRVAATLTSNAICATEVQCDSSTQVSEGTGAAKVCKMKKIGSTDTRRLAAELQCDKDSDCTETNKCDTTAKKCQFFNFCPEGQYVSSGNVHDSDSTIECKAVTTCSAGMEYETEKASQTSDTVCQAVKKCDAFGVTPEYESQAPTSDADRECLSVTPCSAAEFLSAKFTATSNNVCTAYSKCDVGTHYLSVAPTPTEDLQCAALRVCSSTEYQTAAPVSGSAGGSEMFTSDRSCATKTTCPNTQYDAQTDATLNADCTALTVCTSSEFQSTAATKTADRQCSAVSQCTSETQFEKVAPTTTTDRQCEDATVCYDGSSAVQTKYYISYHAAASDAVCADVSICGASSYMLSAPTATTDRRCSSRQTCSNAEYISNSEANGYNVTNSVVDATCAALSVCDSAAGEVQVTEPTKTSNRVCGTKSPTASPTTAPTNAPTAALEVTDESIVDKTLPPTMAPTMAPAEEGFVYVTEKVQSKAVTATIEFPLTPEEARSAPMQLSMRNGTATATGVLLKFVEIESITGSTRRLRTAAAKTDVKFKITAEKPKDIDALARTVEAKAAEGSIVHEIKKEASKNGVLTQSLNAMANEVTVTTATVDAEYTISKQVPAGPDSGLSDLGTTAIIATVLFVAAIAIVVMVMKRGNDNGPQSPAGYGQTEDPVGYDQTEDRLGTVKQY